MKIVSKIKSWNGFLTAKGKLTDKTEIHAFGLGLMHGCTFARSEYKQTVDWASEHNEDVEKETHYYEAGYFLTNRTKWVATGFLGSGLI